MPGLKIQEKKKRISFYRKNTVFNYFLFAAVWERRGQFNACTREKSKNIPRLFDEHQKVKARNGKGGKIGFKCAKRTILLLQNQVD